MIAGRRKRRASMSAVHHHAVFRKRPLQSAGEFPLDFLGLFTSHAVEVARGLRQEADPVTLHPLTRLIPSLVIRKPVGRADVCLADVEAEGVRPLTALQ